MTVETLDQIMNYAIEGWMLISGTYLSVAFIGSLIQRIMQDIQDEIVTSEQLQEMTDAVTDTVADTERLAAVSAVAQKYTKTANSEPVSNAVSVSES